MRGILEREHVRLLGVLHQEIEQLQRKCGDIILDLASALTLADGLTGSEIKGTTRSDLGFTNSTINDLQAELDAARKELVVWRQLNENKDQKINAVERRYNEQENRFREDLDRKNKKLKEITVDLNQKSAVITQVMTQLHQLRLREAVDKQKRQLGDQQARRRQLLLTSTKSLLANSWLQGANVDSPSFDSMPLFDAQLRQPGMRLPTAPGRLSILPPIYTSGLTQATSSSLMANIEKPEPARSTYRASFRRASFGQNEQN